MKTMILKLGIWLSSVQTALVGLGFVGICAIAFLDAALIPLPGGPDAVLFASTRPASSLMCWRQCGLHLTLWSSSLRRHWRRDGGTPIRSPSSVTECSIDVDIWALVVAAVLPPPFRSLLIPAGSFT
jgi:hypothetical protein